MTGDIVVDGLPYPVVIADDASAALPGLIRPDCRRAVVIHDASVDARARAIASAIEDAGAKVAAVVAVAVDARTKSAHTIATLYDALVHAGADRQTWVVAIGGGTLTDAAGFAAATFLRGIPWAVVPTTVLGMADAAIGGKTAIDLPHGKNLVGSFWAPRAVVADALSLVTLSARDRATGVAEIVKCAVIGDSGLFEMVDRLDDRCGSRSWRAAIAAAARIKAEVVARDPMESGERAVLNLGHTVAHGIEAASAYAVPHGEAVSIGLRAAGLLARGVGWWPGGDHARLLRSLERAGLPLAATGIDPDAVFGAMRRDKKSVDGRMRFVLPVRIGDVRHGIDVASAHAREVVETIGTAPPASEWNV